MGLDEVSGRTDVGSIVSLDQAMPIGTNEKMEILGFGKVISTSHAYGDSIERPAFRLPRLLPLTPRSCS